MIGVYDYTVILTYVSLGISLFGLAYAFQGNTEYAVIMLMLSGICDMFDGKIARTKSGRTTDEKRFGIQIDSLCDLVCFGVLPAAIGLSLGYTAKWQLFVMALFVLCGLIRLAYFNVTEETRQNTSGERRRIYTGLPITSSAVLFPLLLCFKNFAGACFPVLFSLAQLIIAALFVSKVEIKKPGNIGIALIAVLGIIILIAFLFTNS